VFSLLCQAEVETAHHLFITFSFAKSCWNLVHITLEEDIPFQGALQAIRNQSHPKFFMMVAIMLPWAIWNARNDLIFQQHSTQLAFCERDLQKRDEVAHSEGKS
jgi:hypothetical protein